MRIAVVCPNLVGDAVMATPMLWALRHGYPEARFVGLMRPAVAATLAGGPWWDEEILLNKKIGNDFGVGVRALRRERLDIAVLLPNSFRSALQVWLGGARRRVGYARGGRSWLLTDRLTPLKDAQGAWVPTPIVEYYLALAHRLGCPSEGVLPKLFTTWADELAMDRVSAEIGWGKDRSEVDGDSAPRPRVCLNTGGAFGPAKAWPEEYFGTLARNLAETVRAQVLVICGPSERDSARAIVRMADHPDVVSLADQPVSIGLSKACVKRADCLITTDSGPRHFATGFGVPVLTIFGPTHIAWTRTYHPHAWHIAHPVPCGPCQRPTCHLGHHRCMRELHPDQVLAAAQRLLHSARRRHPTQTRGRLTNP